MDDRQDKDAENFIRLTENALSDLGSISFTHFTPSIKVGRRYLGVEFEGRTFMLQIDAFEKEV